uniref:Chroparavirus methyltransferase domain-containing protein n=1 Tax=Riboviria sp. TaxID=2585031 RepID=A0A8K1U401_9VIRU|nr:MAG: hypothetical protein 1 [Riboviria sp.]
MFRYRNKIRDIGGSLKRLSKYGKRVHVCYANLTAADHAKDQSTDSVLDVHYHDLQHCNHPELFGIMCDVDYHISLTDMAESIKSPTIMLTHRFKSGDINWYGETSGFATHNFVSMSTRGGAEYSHPHHGWKDEGFIMSGSNVVNYQIIGEYGTFSAYILYPANGSYTPIDPARLICTRGVELSRPLSLGDNRTAILSGSNYHVIDNEVDVGVLPATTVLRAAYSMFLVSRTATYAQNLASIVRSRFTQDKLDHALLPVATLLVSTIADKLALRDGHRIVMLPETVVGMSLYTRLMSKVIIYCYNSLPQSCSSLAAGVFRRALGASIESSWLPWLWRDIVTPNYEVHVPQKSSGQAEMGKRAKPTQPFRGAGSECHAGPSDDNKRVAGKHVGKSSSLRGDKGVVREIPTSPIPVPKRKGKVSSPAPNPKAGPSVTKESNRSTSRGDGVARLPTKGQSKPRKTHPKNPIISGETPAKKSYAEVLRTEREQVPPQPRTDEVRGVGETLSPGSSEGPQFCEVEFDE